jgi:N-methylhydantoinase B
VLVTRNGKIPFMPRPTSFPDDPFDPITLEVLWSRLVALVDEGAAALKRTAFSVTAREANDLSTALCDPAGNAVAQCSTSTPLHTGVLSRTVRHFLARYPAGSGWAPGDVAISNDPWKGTGHKNDISVCAPVYHGGQLVAFVAADSHAPDIGGLGGFAADGRDVYEEGLGIPMLKLYRAGALNEDLVEVVRENVRQPDLVVGDLHARVAALHVMARRLTDVLHEQSLDGIDTLSAAIRDRAARAMRAAIAAVPDGDYPAAIETDGFDAPITLRATVRVRGEALTVDYAGTDPQSAHGINVVFNYTYAQTVFALKCLLDPDTPHNEGHAEPVDVVAPGGSVLNPRFPAPVNGRALVGHYVPALVIAALAPALPERAIADCGAPRHISSYRGRHADGRPFALDLQAAGGMGAGSAWDGLPCTPFPTNTVAASVEALEEDGVLRFREKALREGSGGAGRHRGGDGQRIVFEVLAPEVQMSPHVDRVDHPPAGLFGGAHGAPASLAVNGTPIHPKRRYVLRKGDIVEITTPGGGGYGSIVPGR